MNCGVCEDIFLKGDYIQWTTGLRERNCTNGKEPNGEEGDMRSCPNVFTHAGSLLIHRP